jgi:hypothetical protein
MNTKSKGIYLQKNEWSEISPEFCDSIVNNIGNFESAQIKELRPAIIVASLYLEFSQNWLDQVPSFIQDWIDTATAPDEVDSLKKIVRFYVVALVEISAWEEEPEQSLHRIIADQITTIINS